MKLPGIEYNTNVRSLGREDPSQPVTLARMKANVALGTADVLVKTAEAIQANDIAADAARFQTMMSEFNATTKARQSYNIKELDTLDIKYGPQYGEGKLTEVPAYLVSRQVYQKGSRQIFKTVSDVSSKKGKAVISKMYGQMYKEGVSSIIASSIQEAYKVKSVNTEIDFNASVASGNMEASMIIAETARASGIWNSDKYLAMTKGMPDKIGHSQYLNNLNREDDPVMLELHKENALSDPNLKPSTKSSLYKEFDGKIKILNKAKDKAANETRKQESYERFISTSASILDSNEPMDFGAAATIALGLEPTDGKALMTLNRIVADKGATDDAKVVMGLTNAINTISIPRPGTTIHQRRKSVTDMIQRAAGYDPFTGEQVGPSKLSANTYSALWKSINTAQAFVYQNPEVKNMSDFIWTTLTGGSKDMMTKFFGTGPDTMNAVQAETEMHKAAMAAGPGFNPTIWWESNGIRYVTASIEENEKSMKENRIDKYIVRDIKAPGGIDIDATGEALRNRVKSGTMDENDMKNAMRDIYDLRKQRIQRAEMFEKTKGSK